MSDIGLVQFTNSPMTVSHTTRHVAQARIDDLFLCRQIAGSLTLEQEAREVVLKPGHMALLDPMLPYGGRFSSESNLLVVKLLRRGHSFVTVGTVITARKTGTSKAFQLHNIVKVVKALWGLLMAVYFESDGVAGR